MPYEGTVDGKRKWEWGNIVKNTTRERVKDVYGICSKNGKKGKF